MLYLLISGNIIISKSILPTFIPFGMGYHFVLKVRFSGDDPVMILFLFPLRSERLFQNRTFFFQLHSTLNSQHSTVQLLSTLNFNKHSTNVAHRCKRLFSSEVYLEKCCTYAFCHIFFFSNRSATYPKTYPILRYTISVKYLFRLKGATPNYTL